MAYKGYPSFGWYAWMLYLQEHSKSGPHPTSEMAEPEPSLWKQRVNPDPVPWIVSAAVSFLVSAATVKDVAARVTNEKARAQMISGAERSIDAFLDDYCGTPPRLIPWPWPGPPPWVVQIASELSLIANTFQDGVLRNGILDVAGQVMERAANAVAH
jgi:hypothetical protein